MTASPPETERFYGLFRDYLGSLDGAARFAAALGTVDGTRTVAVPAESPPGEFIAAADWQVLASPAGTALVGAFAAALHTLPWHDPVGDGYAAKAGLTGYAATTGRIGPKAMVPATDVAGGFFVVAPGVDYCDHQHAPEELYLPIAGRARFWNEGDGWREAGPDTVMVHPPWQWHAMQTTDQPVLILWMWLGPEGLADVPRLRPGMGGVAP